MTRHIIIAATFAAWVLGTAAAMAADAPNSNCVAGSANWAQCVISQSQTGGE